VSEDPRAAIAQVGQFRDQGRRIFMRDRRSDLRGGAISQAEYDAKRTQLLNRI